MGSQLKRAARWRRLQNSKHGEETRAQINLNPYICLFVHFRMYFVYTYRNRHCKLSTSQGSPQEKMEQITIYLIC